LILSSLFNDSSEIDALFNDKLSGSKKSRIIDTFDFTKSLKSKA